MKKTLIKLLNKILTRFGFCFVSGLGIYKRINPLANIDMSKCSGPPFGIIQSTDPLKGTRGEFLYDPLSVYNPLNKKTSKETNGNMKQLLTKLLNKLKIMTEKISSSPLPQQVKKIDEIDEVMPNEEMDFPSAIREVINGKKITRVEWLDREFYGFLNGNILSLHKPDGNNYKWIISDGDLSGGDWFVV